MTTSLPRLVLPVTGRFPREELRTVLPRPLRAQLEPPADPRAAAGPVLLAFRGTRFMEAFFAWLAGQGPLPSQRAWRDWCEPPTTMLAGEGVAAYPATIQRGIPWGLTPEPASGTGLNPDGVPSGRPPWLRKLYLPQHDRFNLVAFEVICRAPGWPPLDRERVRGAGLLVRRLRRLASSDASDGEPWEDWIAVDERHGRWQLLHNASMVPLAPSRGGASTPVDPGTVAGLTSQPLALVPVTRGEETQACGFYGYLSTTGAEQEIAAAPAPVGTRRVAAEEMRRRAAAALDSLEQAGMRPGPSMDLVLQLLQDTVLPPPPIGVTGDAAVEPKLRRILLFLIQSALKTDRFADDVGADVISGQALWVEAAAEAKPPAELPGIWTANLPQVLARLYQLLEEWITDALPASAAGTEPLLQALLTAALVRARGCRLALATAMNTAQAIDQDLTELDSSITGSRALHSLADLGEGLESFLALETERGGLGGLASWGTYTRPGGTPGEQDRLERVDATVRALAGRCFTFESLLAEAGAQARFVLAERAGGAEGAMAAALDAVHRAEGLPGPAPGMPSLLERGVDLLEPPALGLLVLPGVGSDALRLRSFSTFRAASLARYDGLRVPHAGQEDAVAEVLLANGVLGPRFDADHIYAVWAWVRVAGRSPGEPERVIWSPRSEPFVLAEPMDLLGAQPVTVPMPSLARLLRDLPRLRKAGADPFLTMVSPPRSGITTGSGLGDSRRDWGLGTAVSVAAPVLAIVGLGTLARALRIFSHLPGFAWIRQLMRSMPTPERRP